MKTFKRKFGPFLGLQTRLHGGIIRDPYSAAGLNMRLVDGALQPRLGYDVLEAAQSGFASVWGLEYIQGYDSSNTLIEEFVTIENLGVATRPYSRNISTGAPTVITNGGSGVSLHSSDWTAFTFVSDGTLWSYFINPNDTYPVWKHAPGNNSSFTPMGVAPAPTVALGYAISAAYTSQVFTGIDLTNAAEMVVTGGFFNTSGALSSSVLSDGTAKIIYSTAALQVSSFKLDISETSGGAKDYTKNDIFQFTMKPVEPASPFGVNGSRLNVSSIKPTFFNTAGTEFVPEEVKVIESGNASSGYTYTIRCRFKKVTRSDWSSMEFVKIECFFDSIEEAGFLEVKPYTVGKTDMRMSPLSEGDHRLFAYANLISSTNFESSLYGVSKGGSTQYLKIPNTELIGSNPVPGLDGLGVHITFTMTASSDAAVDKVQLYTRIDGKWVQLVSQNDGGTSPTTSTWTEYRTADDCRQITTLYSGTGGAKFDMMTCGTPHKGCVIWGTKGGYRNIRWTRIGNAERFAEDIDENLPDEDLNQGNTFSLADNYGDEPLAIFSVGDVAIILGSNGVYAQVGNTPLEATPPKKLPDSVGCANKLACCLWKDDAGNPGVAFLSKDGTKIWFALVDQSFDGISGFRLIEVSDALGIGATLSGQDLYSLMALQTLESTQTAWTSIARLYVDHFGNGLNLCNGRRRVMRFAPVSAVDGSRQWELKEYVWSGTANDLKLRYVSSTERRGYYVMDHSGRLLMMEYDWTSANPVENPYAGSGRDGGTSILAKTGGVPDVQKTSVYWQSATLGGAYRRTVNAYVEWAGAPPTLNGKTFQTGKAWVRFPITATGKELTYSFGWVASDTLTDLGDDAVILGAVINEVQLNERVRY